MATNETKTATGAAQEPTLATVGMDIWRAEKLAKEHGSDSCMMTVIGPRGVLTGAWLDAYFGLFRPDGSDGFVTTQQLDEAGFRCLALFGPDGEQIEGRS
jgi:hypothetical protein